MLRKRSQFKCVIKEVQEVGGKATLHLEYVTKDSKTGHLVLSIDQFGVNQLDKDMAESMAGVLAEYLTNKRVDIQFQ